MQRHAVSCPDYLKLFEASPDVPGPEEEWARFHSSEEQEARAEEKYEARERLIDRLIEEARARAGVTSSRWTRQVPQTGAAYSVVPPPPGSPPLRCPESQTVPGLISEALERVYG